MTGRMSNRDRIARAAAEAAATRKQQQSEPKKAAAKKAAPKKASKKAAPARTRIVWAVCDHSGSTVLTFPYAQEQEARAEAERRSGEAGKPFFVKQSEVPFT